MPFAITTFYLLANKVQSFSSLYNVAEPFHEFPGANKMKTRTHAGIVRRFSILT